MMTYNAAFFGLFENIFKLIKSEEGEDKAIATFTKLMRMGLSKSYGTDFSRGELKVFQKLVRERDQMVGLRVNFDLRQEQLVYQFLDDPFPNLKGEVDPYKLDNCYMAFKLNHILGEEWHYKTTKHLWLGDELTEHIIYR